MAKAKTTTDTTESPAPDVNAPINLKVQGLIFSFQPKYGVGHVLSQVEADVLNQTFGENLRNNFASRMRDAAEEIAKATPAGETPREFNEEEKAAFAEAFATYAAEYTFKAPRAGAGPVDPIEAETAKIAKAIVLAHLAKKNIKVASLPEGNLATLIKGLIAKQPGIREEAVRRVDALKAAGDTALDDLMG